MRGGLRQKCDATNQDTICGLAGELKLSLRTRLDQVHTCACVSKHAWDNRWVFWRVLLKWYHLGIQAPRIFDQLHAANINAWRVCDFPGRSSPSCFPQSHVGQAKRSPSLRHKRCLGTISRPKLGSLKTSAPPLVSIVSHC